MINSNTEVRVNQGSNSTPLIGLIVLVIIWGVNWPIMKVGIAGIGAAEFALLRAVLGAVTMFVVTAALGVLRWPPKEDRLLILHLGLMQTGAFLLLISLGVDAVGAGKSAILAYTTPIWVAPLSVLFLKERPSGAAIAGSVLALLGLFVLLGPAEIDWNDKQAVTGNLFLVAAALVWSLAIVHVRGHSWKSSPLQAVPWQLSIASLFLFVWWLVVEPAGERHWSPEVISSLVFNGIVATGLAFWLMTAASKRLPALLTSLVSLAVPVIGVTTSAWTLQEPVSESMLIGGSLVLAGLMAPIFNLIMRETRQPAT